MQRPHPCTFLPLLLSFAALAAPGQTPITAQRTSDSIHLNGELTEGAWTTAPVYSDFVESFPSAGAKPSLRTEAKVLYDDEFLYFGITCFDPQPSLIQRQLGRRDSAPTSDALNIALDSNSDGRAAASFIVNAAGVLSDQLLFGDVNSTDSWDTVWDASVKVTDQGWVAEIAIPFRALRFPPVSEQNWGVVIRRVVPRTHQVFDSTLIPREANQIKAGKLVVSRFGRLVGIKDVQPHRSVELVPYVGARTTFRPQYSDPSRPTPRLIDPSLDVGLDFRTPLTSHLMLTGAINPDFGQVEADQVVQNLSTSEPFFPEKRPFFLEGLDIFQPVGAEYSSPQQLFYSRRIGLDAPILGAIKISGSAREGLDVGLLEAMVMGAGNSAFVPVGYLNADPDTITALEANPDRRVRFHLTQPLHLGTEDSLPTAHPVTTNYLAAVARQRFFAASSVGATFTSAVPLEPRCRPKEFPNLNDYFEAGCKSRGANTFGLDVNLRDGAGEWGGFAQVEASQEVGGDEGGRVLRDGTVMKPGDLGFGGHMRAGKLGGEPFRFDVTYVYEDPKLNLNDMGFQPISNYQWADLNLHYVRPSGFGDFHEFRADYNLDLNWTADGEWLPRGINTNIYSGLQLPSFDSIGARLALELPQYDTREIPRAGVPFERAPDMFVAVEFGSDPSRQLFANGDVFYAWSLPAPNVKPITAIGWDLAATWRPQQRLETRLNASWGHKPQGPRFVDYAEENGNTLAIFGEQDPEFLSVTLRQQYVVTPHLTAQLYAQLYSDAVRYSDRYFSANVTGVKSVALADLAPASYGSDPSAHSSVLNLNAVLRWEYRLGSTLYLVYTRSQSELPAPPGAAPEASVLPSRLFSGPVTESVLLKWSYWWAS